METNLELLIILALIFVNGFFALSEIAFVASRREEIESFWESKPRRVKLILTMMDNPDRFLSSIQVGITLVGIVSGVYGGVALADDFSQLLARFAALRLWAYDISIILVVSFITYLTIVMGELVPKAIGLRNPEKTILAVIPVIHVFSRMVGPVVKILSWSTNGVMHLLRMKPAIIESEDPLHEILSIARAATVKNLISREQAGIIIKTTNLRSVNLDRIMVDRKDIKYLSTDMSLTDALDASHRHYHTRLPLKDFKTGEYVGYINFKDLENAIHLKPQVSLEQICRPMISFRDSDSLNSALGKLITSHQHIAFVRNARGGIVGMVTLEDILETIVGDIKDEYDIIPDYLHNISHERLVAGGAATLNSVKRVLGSSIEGNDRTLDEWIREMLGENLRVEFSFEYGDLYFRIRKVSRSHVYEIIVEKRHGKTAV